MPENWGNSVGGGICFANDSFIAYSGKRHVKKGETLVFDFDLLFTPFKEIVPFGAIFCLLKALFFLRRKSKPRRAIITSDYYIKNVDKNAFTVYNENRIYVPIEARGNSPRE